MLENIIPENNEVWLPVVGFEGLYEVSDMGRVRRSVPSPRKPINSIMPQYRTRCGYVTVSLLCEKIYKPYKVHRLLAMAYIPNPENKKTVNHKNGVRYDNRLENLEWATYSENIQHAFDVLHKLSTYGERHGLARLREEDIIAIRNSPLTCKELADIYSVHTGHIWAIKERIKWKHVK